MWGGGELHNATINNNNQYGGQSLDKCAANIIEAMESKGILSAQQSNGNREILKKDN